MSDKDAYFLNGVKGTQITSVKIAEDADLVTIQNSNG